MTNGGSLCQIGIHENLHSRVCSLTNQKRLHPIMIDLILTNQSGVGRVKIIDSAHNLKEFSLVHHQFPFLKQSPKLSI